VTLPVHRRRKKDDYLYVEFGREAIAPSPLH